ncbi:unnamed protein product, partial [Prorocentrum cordatum]
GLGAARAGPPRGGAHPPPGLNSVPSSPSPAVAPILLTWRWAAPGAWRAERTPAGHGRAREAARARRHERDGLDVGLDEDRWFKDGHRPSARRRRGAVGRGGQEAPRGRRRADAGPRGGALPPRPERRVVASRAGGAAALDPGQLLRSEGARGPAGPGARRLLRARVPGALAPVPGEAEGARVLGRGPGVRRRLPAVAPQGQVLCSSAPYVGGWARRASGTPGGGSAPGLNRSLYLHAVRCLLSRVHGTDSKGGRALVPGGDMFNHHFLHNARWTYQAGPPGFFAVLAAKPIAEGQEVVISYGDDLSNEELMDQYGFTQAPYWEPFHTFFLFMEEAPDGSMRHPGFEISDKTRSLMLKTPIVIEGVGARNFPNEFLSFVDAHNSTWRDILRQHLEFHLRRYGSDASLELLVATWRANREQSPRTAVWWTPLPSCRSDYGSPAEDDSGGCAGERDLSAELAAGSFVAESVLRVKMTEYVALTAYSEMLDILEGRRDWRSALMSATGMADMLDFDLRRYSGGLGGMPTRAPPRGRRVGRRGVPAAGSQQVGQAGAGALQAVMGSSAHRAGRGSEPAAATALPAACLPQDSAATPRGLASPFRFFAVLMSGRPK